MRLRERILQRMDNIQRIVFVIFLGIALLSNVLLELYDIRTYHLELIHLGLIFAIIQVIFNPQGIRLLFFAFFTFLLMKVFPIRFDHPFMLYDSNRLIFGGLLQRFNASIETIVYSHLTIYSLLAYFSFKNPFNRKKVEDSGLIDSI